MMKLSETFLFETNEHSSRELKHDFIDYCVDLQKVESGHLYWDEKVGFAYHELFEMALKKYPILKDKIEHAHVIVVVHAEYEYDPEYSHIVSYLMNRLQLTSSVFSVHADRKKLLVTAEHLLEQTLSPNECGLIMDFQQPILPLIGDCEIHLPDLAAVRFYFYAKECV